MIEIVNKITNNLGIIYEHINHAAILSGRQSDCVKLIIVTKGRTKETIEAVINAGGKLFGENYPEETKIKMSTLDRSSIIEWHMIGHLQNRKVSIVAQNFQMMHSIDRVSIAERLNGTLAELKRHLPVLLEFNMSGESSKYGWQASNESDWSLNLSDIEKIICLSNLDVKGLMTMPPQAKSIEETRKYFIQLRKLRDFLAKKFPQIKWNDLSMGTSNDYEIAIQEGATYVRIGQAIFNPNFFNIDKM